ncbi:MAG: hypothetical protein ABJ056_05735 [Halioglobus sp.]
MDHMTLKVLLTILLLSQSSGLLAAITVNFYEQGGDVVAEASGSLDVSGGTAVAGTDVPFIGTNSTTYFGYIFGAFLPGAQDQYRVPFTSEQPFGPDPGSRPTSSSGDTVGIAGALSGSVTPDADFIYVPGGYTSGDPVSGSSIWSGASLASLTLVPGSYTFTYAEDSITFNVLTSPPTPTPTPTPTPVPTLSTYGLALTAIGLLIVAGRRLRTRRQP